MSTCPRRSWSSRCRRTATRSRCRPPRSPSRRRCSTSSADRSSPRTGPSPMTLATAATLPASVVMLGLVEPLPGFPRHRDYVLVAASDGQLFWLQSVVPDGPRFLAVPPAVYFPDYAPVLPGTVCAELDLE